MIGTVATEAHAQRLSDHLLTQQIDAHIEENATGQWQMWVEHDDDLDRARAEFAAFVNAPDDPRYDNAAAIAKRARKDREKAAQRRQQNYTDVRTSPAWSGAQLTHSTPIAIGLIAACVIIHFLRTFEMAPFVPHLFFDATPPAMFDDIASGQVWRLITPIFLHGGLLHLLFNMMWMWRLGPVIEGVKGSGFFLVLVIVIAMVSNTAQAGWYEIGDRWNVFIGISGVVSGLFGYAWMKHKLQPYEGIHVSDQEVGLMLGMLVLFSLGIGMQNVANAAHWGGLAIGVLIGAAPYLKRRFLRG